MTANKELAELLQLLDFQGRPQEHVAGYAAKFSKEQIQNFLNKGILVRKFEYPKVCKSCANEAQVISDGGRTYLVDVKNTRHSVEIDDKDFEYFKLDVQKAGSLIAVLLKDGAFADVNMLYEVANNEEYFEVKYSCDERQFSVIVLNGNITKEIIYEIILDLAETERGFFLFFPDRNYSLIEESLPFIQGRLLGMINFTNTENLRPTLKSIALAADTYFSLLQFEKGISDTVLKGLDQKYSDIIRKVDTNPKYLLNLISRLGVYDASLTSWMNFEKLVKLAVRYLFPGDLSIGGSQNTGKPISDSINFVRNKGDVKMILIVDAKRSAKENLKGETTEKYERYVGQIKDIMVYGLPKLCVVFVGPSFGDITDFARRFVAKCPEAYVCTMDIHTLLTILRLKLSFLLSSSLELRDTSLETLLGKLFDSEIVSKYRTFRTHYNLDTALIIEIMTKEGTGRSEAFAKEVEKIRDSVGSS